MRAGRTLLQKMYIITQFFFSSTSSVHMQRYPFSNINFNDFRRARFSAVGCSPERRAPAAYLFELLFRRRMSSRFSPNKFHFSSISWRLVISDPRNVHVRESAARGILPGFVERRKSTVSLFEATCNDEHICNKTM